jgi:hypothetical protein
MKNYAEELAYWYLRFNGFFIINNHVAHGGDRRANELLNARQAGAHSDSDLLAIKTPYVREDVGINEHRCETITRLIADDLFAGVICEIKSGEDDTITNANLPVQIKRIGLFEYTDDIKRRLEQESTFHNDRKGIIKILIKNNGTLVDSWNVITIQYVTDFIRERFRRLRDRKLGGWDKFDSSLMQFLLKHP